MGGVGWGDMEYGQRDRMGPDHLEGQGKTVAFIPTLMGTTEGFDTEE